jgi:hypothetical protein
MKHRYYFFAFILTLLTGFAAEAQQLVSAQLLGSRTAAQLSTQFAPLTLQFGAKFYKITYTTPDVKGVRDTASGLLVLPDRQPQ